ncbi:MAG: restriction endonuclease [Ignavibacteria bacterium]|nr:restriction endonuclease [Ignavibacteria bacterium]
MEYNLFKQILNETIFEKSKADLLEKISISPNRYVGLFRPTKPKAKILQNLLQSHEIRFGDAFEIIIEEYLKIIECNILPKQFINNNGEVLKIDQCFRKKDKVFFIEQKIRDDHDSTKKRGQIQNFEKKLNVMLTKYEENKLVGVFYFIDPVLVKNKNYYSKELSKITNDYNVETHIFYGKALFDYLGYSDIWDEILEYLATWKEEIPDLPEISFDLDALHTFEEIKDLKPLVFRKLLENDEVYNEIVLTLFPEKETLKLLHQYYSQKQETIYKTILTKLNERLKSNIDDNKKLPETNVLRDEHNNANSNS